MKRTGHLYDRIAEPENLREAFLRSVRGKRGKAEVIAYAARLNENLHLLREQLLARRVDVGHYRFFKVFEPKERAICAAAFPERVLHHAVMNVCEPVLERYAIHDSYACRKGKGMHAAVNRARDFTRRYQWYLYATVPGKGLPIGNLLSQHLANFYLGHLDHWIKETLRVKGYVRYMDDFVLWAADKETLRNQLSSVRCFLAEKLGLELNASIQLNRSARGVPFLGYRVFPHRLALGSHARRRFARKLRGFEQAWSDGRWSESELARHMEALLSYVRFADSLELRRDLVNRFSRAA